MKSCVCMCLNKVSKTWKISDQVQILHLYLDYIINMLQLYHDTIQYNIE